MANLDLTQEVAEVLWQAPAALDLTQQGMEILWSAPALPPFVPSDNIQAGAGGAKPIQQLKQCQGNRHDRDLEQLLQRGQSQQRLCRRRYKMRAAWIDMPPGATRFAAQNAVATPAPSDGEVLVTQIRVPLGQEAALKSMANYYTGHTWVQGSSDLIFRLKLNRVWDKDLGNIVMQLGSTARPWPLSQAVRSRSQSVISLYVRNTNALHIPPGIGAIVGRLEGWFVPLESGRYIPA